MPAAIGERTCPEITCRRPVHVTPGGSVWARCIAHTLARLSDSRLGRGHATPVVATSSPEPVAVSAHRP